jgi:SAM-dependent methyltransferase
MTQAFDPIAESYDRWYDSAEGRIIFKAELSCLRMLCGSCPGRWLEVGVGTGRFASSLGVGEGIDPSPRMLEIAAKRGIVTYEGRAEALPFPDGTFSGVLLAVALCFIDKAEQALRECHRVLTPNGQLLLGDIPADSSWGRAYTKKGSEGRSIYSRAKFHTFWEMLSLAERAGFALRQAAGTLFWEPGATSEHEPLIMTGIVREAGFLGLLFTKEGTGPQHIVYDADPLRDDRPGKHWKELT